MTEPQQTFWGFDDLALVIGAVLPSMFVASLSVITLRAAGNTNIAVEGLLGQSILYVGVFFTIFALFRIRHQQPFWKSLSWSGTKSDIARYLLLGPPVALGVMLLSVFMDAPDGDMPMKDLLSSKSNVVLVGLFAITVAPLCEELVFRGFIMPLISKVLGAVAGIVITGAMFGALHLPEYGYSWRHGVLISLAGIAFGWARFKTGSTAAAVVMHATYNLTVFSAFFAQGDNFKTW